MAGESEVTHSVRISAPSLARLPLDELDEAARGTLFVPSPQPPRVGTQVTVEVGVGDDAPVRLAAFVVWSRPARSGVTAGFRARIENPPAELMKQIIAAVEVARRSAAAREEDLVARSPIEGAVRERVSTKPEMTPIGPPVVAPRGGFFTSPNNPSAPPAPTTGWVSQPTSRTPAGSWRVRTPQHFGRPPEPSTSVTAPPEARPPAGASSSVPLAPPPATEPLPPPPATEPLPPPGPLTFAGLSVQGAATTLPPPRLHRIPEPEPELPAVTETVAPPAPAEPTPVHQAPAFKPLPDVAAPEPVSFESLAQVAAPEPPAPPPPRLATPAALPAFRTSPPTRESEPAGELPAPEPTPPPVGAASEPAPRPQPPTWFATPEVTRAENSDGGFETPSERPAASESPPAESASVASEPPPPAETETVVPVTKPKWAPVVSKQRDSSVGGTSKAPPARLSITIGFSSARNYVLHYERFLARGQVYIVEAPAPTVGSVVTVTLAVPDGGEPVRARATVMRSVHPPEVPRSGWLAALADRDGSIATRLANAATSLADQP